MTHQLTDTHADVVIPSAGGNAGDYAFLDVETNDEKLIKLWLYSEERSPLTQASYERTWRNFSQFVGKPLQEVKLDDLKDWRSQLTGKNSTVKTQLATIRSLFSFAQKIGYVRVNIGVMVKTPKTQTKAVTQRVLSRGTIERALDACQTDRESALVRCLYSSGARISEVLALRWQDVTPRQAKDGMAATLYIAHGKGDKDRTVGIDADAYAALLRLRGDDTQPDAYVFSTRTGKAVDRQAAHATLKRILRRAGLPDNASAHWLRHSHATHYLNAGGNVADLQAQLGHASLSTTSLYVHASEYSSDKLSFQRS